jgi:hypothetical protein
MQTEATTDMCCQRQNAADQVRPYQFVRDTGWTPPGNLSPGGVDPKDARVVKCEDVPAVCATRQARHDPGGQLLVPDLPAVSQDPGLGKDEFPISLRRGGRRFAQLREVDRGPEMSPEDLVNTHASLWAGVVAI